MQAKNFSLPDKDGNWVSLEDFRGKKVILYFYPKDNTPGCTTEACDFRDNLQDFSDLDCVIIGISKDSSKAHSNFTEKYNLPFTLLSDVEHKTIEEYGVWVLKKNYGKEYMGIERSTFLIDEEGQILKEWRKVRVKDHISQILEELR